MPQINPKALPAPELEVKGGKQEVMEDEQAAVGVRRPAKTKADPKTKTEPRKVAAPEGGVPSGSDPIKFLQENPKGKKSVSYARYDKYKAATTVTEALELSTILLRSI